MGSENNRTARGRHRTAHGCAQLFEFCALARGKGLGGRGLTYGRARARKNTQRERNRPARPADGSDHAHTNIQHLRERRANANSQCPMSNVKLNGHGIHDSAVGIWHSSFDIAAPGCACFNGAREACSRERGHGTPSQGD